jgi:serine/threonine protein kinase
VLKHQNIVEIKQIFETTEHIILVYELVKGGNLGKHLRELRKKDVKEIMRIVWQLIDAVGYLHSKNIAHRDLKLENILMTPLASPVIDIKVCDFGLATFVHELAGRSLRCGTPGYIAPELFENKVPGGILACDVFSLGVIFYTLLTGKMVFPGETAKEMMESNKACKINFSPLDRDPAINDEGLILHP